MEYAPLFCVDCLEFEMLALGAEVLVGSVLRSQPAKVQVLELSIPKDAGCPIIP
jgi:hypothetical protein